MSSETKANSSARPHPVRHRSFGIKRTNQTAQRADANGFLSVFYPLSSHPGPSLGRFWDETDSARTGGPCARVLPWPARWWHRAVLFLSAPSLPPAASHSTLPHSSPRRPPPPPCNTDARSPSPFPPSPPSYPTTTTWFAHPPAGFGADPVGLELGRLWEAGPRHGLTGHLAGRPWQGRKAICRQWLIL